MNQKLLVLGMILTLLTGTVTVTAAQIPVVRLNDAEEFEYYLSLIHISKERLLPNSNVLIR